MDIMASNGYAHFNLSKLRTSTGVLSRRRDSHSSKGDSGYDSDLETASSPLDFVNLDQEVPHINRSILCTRYSGLIKPSSHHHSTITSCPTPVAPAAQHYLLDFKASSARNRKISSHYPAEIVKATNLTSQNEDIERWIKDNLPSRNRPQERVSSITSLSSTSSCEMYSTTDDVSDEELEDSNVGQQSPYPLATLKIIKLILRKMEVNLRYAAYRQCTRGNDNSRTSSRSTITSQDSRGVAQLVSKRAFFWNGRNYRTDRYDQRR